MEGIGSCRHYGPLRLRLLSLQHYYRPPIEEEIQCEYKQAWVSGSRFRARAKKRLPHDSARRCLPQEPHTINGSFYPNSNFGNGTRANYTDLSTIYVNNCITMRRLTSGVKLPSGTFRSHLEFVYISSNQVYASYSTRRLASICLVCRLR